MCMVALPTCVQYLRKLEEAIRHHRTRVTCSCDSPCGYWEQNPDPLKEQPVILTAEPSSHLFSFPFLICLLETKSHVAHAGLKYHIA